jgi:hypothetical protein
MLDRLRPELGEVLLLDDDCDTLIVAVACVRSERRALARDGTCGEADLGGRHPSRTGQRALRRSAARLPPEPVALTVNGPQRETVAPEMVVLKRPSRSAVAFACATPRARTVRRTDSPE